MLGDDRAHFEIKILKFDQGMVQNATHKPTNRLKTRISENYVKSSHTHGNTETQTKTYPLHRKIAKTRKNKDKKRGNTTKTETPKAETLNYQNTKTHKPQKQ